MRRAYAQLAIVLAVVPVLTFAQGRKGAPVTSSPHAAAKLQGWAHTLRSAADGFRAGAQQKLEVNKEWLQRVFDVAKEACTMGEELLAWHDAQPPVAWRAIWQCLSQGNGAWTNACYLKHNLTMSFGCGGANGPAYCYEGFANDATTSAMALDAWAACVNIGLTAQAQADAEAKNQPQPDPQHDSWQDEKSGSDTVSKKVDADEKEHAPPDEAKREDEKRQRDSQVRAAYDEKSAEIERRNQIATRWDKGVQRQQELIASQQQAELDLINSIEGGGNSASGASWRVHAFLGAGGIVFPIYVDATGADITSFSSVSLAGGMGFDGSLELWPYFGPHAGIAVAAEGAFGWFPTVNGGAIGWEGYLAARGFAGSDGKLSALVEAGHAWRRGRHSSDVGGGVVDAYEQGTASYELSRVGIGGRLCIWDDPEDPRFCMGGLDAMVFLDLLGFEPATGKRPIVGRLSFWGRGTFVISVDAALDYPAAGTPRFPTEDHDGALVLFRIEKGWDWFGDPYGETAEQREQRRARQKELAGQ